MSSLHGPAHGMAGLEPCIQILAPGGEPLARGFPQRRVRVHARMAFGILPGYVQTIRTAPPGLVLSDKAHGKVIKVTR